jgi:hypothetical protein
MKVKVFKIKPDLSGADKIYITDELVGFEL